MSVKNTYNPPFEITPKILNLVVEISEILTTIKLDSNNPLVPHLRKKNRIKTIRATLAIENNSLNIHQVTAIIEGKRVLGDKKEIQEVKNAYKAYEQITKLKGTNIKHLLKAHKLMMSGLVSDSGMFRSSNVGIVNQKGKVLHLPPQAELIPRLIEQLFSWYKASEYHPLIKSSVFHYEFEFIHPFSDGNGRLGRMWQSKLLGEWSKIFYYLPLEELIRDKQKLYYQNLAKSDKSGNSTSFIEYMLNLIKNALKMLKNDTLNDSINDTLNDTQKALLTLIKANPKATRKDMANSLNLSVITIQRTLDSLIKLKKLERIGAKKNGYYKIT